jgi:excinuclease ABC subunit A
MYLLDEPTTGLHFEDVRRLLTVLSRLVDQGNTVLVIEHNLDVIKTGDWLIDLGPEGGNGGGTIVGTGTPEEIAAIAESHTGRYLAPLLGLPIPVQSTAKKTATRKAPEKSVAKKAVAKKSVATKKSAPAKTPAKPKK